MIKNTVICDRCGKEINENTYYTIDINGNDVHPSKDERVSLKTMCQNNETLFKKINGTEHHYCSECINDISGYINLSKEEADFVKSCIDEHVDRKISELKSKTQHIIPRRYGRRPWGFIF